MKKIVLFTLALAFAATSVNAQNWILGGSAGADYTKTKDLDDDFTSFSIVPSIHYMFNSNWAVGMGIGYEWSQQKATLGDVTQSAFIIRPSLIYFMELGNGFYYTPELFVDLRFGKTNAFTGSDFEDGKTTTFGGGVSLLSFEYRPTNCIGINFAAGNLSFRSRTFNPDAAGDNTVTSALNFGLNTVATVGFRFYF